ncbi:MAG: hypothetical protein ACYTF1_16495 [Planctomycetota bacterium]
MPDFAVNPSGPEFTIQAIGWNQGRSNNLLQNSEVVLDYGQTDPETGTVNVMRMNWTPKKVEQPAQAGWELVFGEDPDLTNGTINLSINPPGNNNPQLVPAITHLEIEILDINGLSCGVWGFNTDQGGPVLVANDFLLSGKAAIPPVPGPVASLAQNWMQTVNINVGNGPAAGSATVIGGPMGLITGPNYIIGAAVGSDLTKAAKVQFYENGVLTGNAVSVPANAPAGLNNYWDHIIVTPEPGAVLLFLGLGGLLMSTADRRRRRR